MYLRHSTRVKNGKMHTYWRLVRSVRRGRRVVQETVAHLGELDRFGRARARNLLEQLVESNADIRQGVNPQLLERERALQQKLNAKAAARINNFNEKGAEAIATALDKEIAELTSRYQEVDAQVRASSPRYAALTRPEPLAVPDIQRLLDQNTVFVIQGEWR